MATVPATSEIPRRASAEPGSGVGVDRRSQISRVPYLPGLDGLRAIAVVAVMVYHANVDWLPGGFLGVEVFFVISGYLITLLIIAEREKTGRVALGHFWLRRAKRLLPALFLMLFLVISYTTLFERDALGQLRGDVAAGLTYVMNWYQIWVGQGYTASGDFAPLRHLWSLAVEEQFYLVWPLVMVALLARGTRQVARAAIGLVVVAAGVAVFMALAFQPGRIGECNVTPEQYWQVGDRCISKLDTLYLSSITRSTGLLLGAAFAMLWRPLAIMRSPVRDKGPLLDLMAVAALGGLGAMVWWVYLQGPEGGDAFLFRGGFVVCALLTLVLIAAVTHRRAHAGAVLGNPLFLWIGTRSYGLYLYHWPIYQAIRKVAGNPLSAAEFAVAMVITVILTEVSYRYVETPIRTGHIRTWWAGLRRSRDPLPRQIVLGGAAVVVAIGLFSSVSLATAPLLQNPIAESLEDAQGAITDLDELLGGSGGGPGPGGPDDGDPGDGAPPTGAPGDGPGTDPGDGGAPPTAPSTEPGVTAPPPTDPPETTTTTTTTTLPPEPIQYLAIGDSVMQGAAQALAANRFIVNAEVSRQMIDAVPLMQELRDSGRFGNHVVLHLGTNGPISQETADALMEPLSQVPVVIVLTIRANRGWTAPNNTILRSLANRPNVIVLDWEVLANDCPGQCFYSDGIHLRPEGTQYYARLIFDVLGI